MFQNIMLDLYDLYQTKDNCRIFVKIYDANYNIINSLQNPVTDVTNFLTQFFRVFWLMFYFVNLINNHTKIQDLSFDVLII